MELKSIPTTNPVWIFLIWHVRFATCEKIKNTVKDKCTVPLRSGRKAD